MSAGHWQHSMCLACFRKRWPHGKYSSWQPAERLRRWETCCFCLRRHKSGIHKKKDPRSRELKCSALNFGSATQ